MAYFLGRDVDVILTCEDVADFIVDSSGTAAREAGAAYSGAVLLAGPNKDNTTTGNDLFAGQTDNSNTYSNLVADLTGCDLGIGATDEDITYMGQRTTLKAEIKKESTIALTRKKSSNAWDVLFNSARSGINADGDGVRDSLEGAPDDVIYGYRVQIRLLNGTEVFVLRNCCVTGHTVSLTADGTSEETLELMSYVDPIITSSNIYVTPTGVGDL
jgi:hypothetical protein